MIDKPIAVALLAAGGSALIYGVTWAQAPDAAMMQAGTQCLPAETVVFNCELPKEIASVCKTPTHLVLRYGTTGKPEVVIASNGKDGKALESSFWSKPHLEDAGVTEQQHLRFKQGEASYRCSAENSNRRRARSIKTPGSPFSAANLMLCWASRRQNNACARRPQ
jgi:hypothetical protein